MPDLKFGRKPPKNAPALMLAPLLTGVTPPPHPTATDNLGTGGWDMLGNDRYGDCVAVTWANVRRMMTRLAGAERYPDLDQVIAFYKTQNPGFPGEDNGMDIQTALEYLVSTGGPDGVKAIAFAKVDHTNVEEVKAAIAIFGYVWTGINVQGAQQDQFGQGEPWDWIAGSQMDGGHSIVTGGYGPGKGPLGGDERFITWAQETSFTDRYWAQGVEEAWVAIFPEHLGSKGFTQGIDVAQLAIDYQAITGKSLPVPGPTPTPVPTPTPAPQPDPGAASFPGATVPVDSRIHQAAARRHLSVTDWLNHHFDTYFDLPEGRAEIEEDGSKDEEGYRDAGTGQFVTQEYAQDHPDTTEHERLD